MASPPKITETAAFFQPVTTTVAITFATTFNTSTVTNLITTLTARPTACPATPIRFNDTGVFERSNCLDRVRIWLSDPVNWLNEDCIRKYFVDGLSVNVKSPVLTLAGVRLVRLRKEPISLVCR